MHLQQTWTLHSDRFANSRYCVVLVEALCGIQNKNDSAMEGIPQSAQERLVSQTAGAWKVAPQMGNG
jgi:hypothetical protein